VLAAPFFLAGAAIIALAPFVIRFYGSKYLPAAPLLQVLAFSPFLLSLQNGYSTFFMLAFGYEKEYTRIVLKATAVNFGVLVPLLFLIWPPMAVAIAGMAVEIFVTLATWLFYRKQSVVMPDAVATA
jgi:O-antigen/teichoic acid export membrane protein